MYPKVGEKWKTGPSGVVMHPNRTVTVTTIHPLEGIVEYEYMGGGTYKKTIKVFLFNCQRVTDVP